MNLLLPYPFRRPCLLFTGMLLFSLSLFSQSQKPNIIYIMADDLGYGDVGIYGQQQIQTPRIDRLAAEGIRFTDHYAGSTVCAPSRCVLMTGYHSGHARIRGNARVPLQSEDVTVAELLQSAGYATGLIGKWGLGDTGTPGTPNKQGFDYFFGYLNQTRAHNYYPDYLWENETQIPLENEVEYAQEGSAKGIGSYATKKVTYSHDLMTEKALGFIEQHATKPFFLYLAYTIPHANNESRLNNEHGMEVPDPGIYTDKNWPEVEKSKAAMISRLDGDVGKIIDLLRARGIAENTLVIFTSDNGPHAEGWVQPDFFDSNGPFKGIKRDLYEGGIRVPMIAWWPERIQAGATSAHISAFWDFLPTACEVAGIAAPQGIDGISYLPSLLGQPQATHDYLYWEFHEQGRKQALRQGNKKLVRLLAQDRYELYDLDQDPGEHHDLSQAQPETLATLKTLMDAARSPSEEFPFEAVAAATPPKAVKGTRLLLVFFASIVILLVGIIMFKINPFLALLGTAILTGFMAGLPIADISPVLTRGFGNTLGGIGIVIGLGIILGQILAEAHATHQISRSLLRAVGERNSPLAVNITGYLASIPVFADAALVIFMPLIRQLSRVTKRPFIIYAVSLGMGLMVTHSMVLPTPGPLAVADNMGLNIGIFLGYAMLVAIPASLAGGWLLGLFLGKYSNIKAEDEPFEALEAETPEERARPLPSGGLSLALLLFPLLLILIGSILGLWLSKDTLTGQLVAFFGDKNVALLLGVIAAGLFLKKYIQRSMSDVLLDAAAASGLILLITGAGGSFGAMITATGIGDFVKESISAWDISLITLGFILSMTMKTAQGSTTVALITASSIVGQIGGGMGTSPVLVALAICAGGMVFTLPNDSGFWVFSRFARLSVPNTLKSWTLGSGIAGFTAFMIVILLSLFAEFLPGL